MCSYPSSSSSFSLVLPCVDVLVADEFCVWATILRTCLALRCGAQIADVPCVCVADVRWAAQLADVPCVADVPCLALRTCLAFPLRTCVAAPNLWTCGRALRSECALRLRCGRALGSPTCGRPLHCVGASNLRTCLVLRLGAHLADVPCVALGRPTLVRPY